MKHPKRKIVFFVPPRVHVLDLNGPVQVFYEACEYGAPYELAFCSVKSEIRSAAGLHFNRLVHFSKMRLKEGDYLFLPGAEMQYLYSDAFKKEKKFFEWIRTNKDKGVNICSVCTGSFIMGEAGLLNGLAGTTHWKRVKELHAAYPEINVQKDILFTHEDGIYTSAGITSGIDLSLAIVEEHHGPAFAHKISRELVVYYRRGGAHTQESVYLNYRNHIHQEIHSVQDYLLEHLDKKPNLEELAQIACMSVRNLTRAFKKATGLTIHAYLQKLRLEELKNLGNNTQLKSAAVAQKIGYKSVKQLRRLQTAGHQ